MDDSHKRWQAVREIALDIPAVQLGPYISQSLLKDPKHLLFSLSRYKSAARLLPIDRSARVLELGCSEGLGTLLLAQHAASVLGVDFDAKAIAQAQAFQRSPFAPTFQCADFIGKNFGVFDAVISMDVIEHIEKRHEHAYMETIVDNMDSTGMCIVGTPNITASPYASPASALGHVNLFSAERLYDLLHQYFHNVIVFGMNDEVLHTGFYAMCHYIIVAGFHKK
ncbi:Methyltransferase type 11 [Solidesulfovibrio fructosivorans JJ]]|uniref:Methyltransferase type 11 n=1 Tax=Solidesulfovibrio fructosivorans JJ] TaxID=596151 RepID=E1JXT8_SOLFR|nr:class I SAM-dependent methyltransferase [Solidesulfovibrio fructosivorans]EFL50861.1 Methyltransferase type 11 [Solidesulfovibrio fructosivorans JJ]]